MAITFVSRKGTSTPQSGTTTTTGTQSHTAGNLLVVVAYHQSSGATVSSVANTAGDTWTKSPKSPQVDGFVRQVEIYYTLSTAGNASDQTTVTYSGIETYTGASVYELSTNAGGFIFLDDQVGAGTSTTPATATLTAANPAVIIAGESFGAAGGWTAGTGYTAFGLDGGGTGSFAGDEYHIVTANEAASGTLSGSAGWLMIAAAFGESGGGLSVAQTIGIFDQQMSGQMIGLVWK